MRIGVLTREWPDQVYGGAGVHVEHLVRALRSQGADVDVHSFGGTEDGARAHAADPELSGANAALQVLSTDLRIAAATGGCDVVHSHTWYADLAGHLSGCCTACRTSSRRTRSSRTARGRPTSSAAATPSAAGRSGPPCWRRRGHRGQPGDGPRRAGVLPGARPARCT
jgi:hypothetical protein